MEIDLVPTESPLIIIIGLEQVPCHAGVPFDHLRQAFTCGTDSLAVAKPIAGTADDPCQSAHLRLQHIYRGLVQHIILLIHKPVTDRREKFPVLGQALSTTDKASKLPVLAPCLANWIGLTHGCVHEPKLLFGLFDFLLWERLSHVLDI